MFHNMEKLKAGLLPRLHSIIILNCIHPGNVHLS